MKKAYTLLWSIVAVTILVTPLVSTASAQEPDLPQMSEGAKAEMNAWMELRNPGEHHKHLEAFVGSWTSEVTMWMEPGAEPMTETAETEIQFILGGRYLEWNHSLYP